MGKNRLSKIQTRNQLEICVDMKFLLPYRLTFHLCCCIKMMFSRLCHFGEFILVQSISLMIYFPKSKQIDQKGCVCVLILENKGASKKLS